MTRIALLCAVGMSTSLLVSKMKKAAEARGLEVEIGAYPEHELESLVDALDVVLLGPQVAYQLAKSKMLCDPRNVPVAVIPMIDYGMMNGEKVLDFALSLRK